MFIGPKFIDFTFVAVKPRGCSTVSPCKTVFNANVAVVHNIFWATFCVLNSSAVSSSTLKLLSTAKLPSWVSWNIFEPFLLGPSCANCSYLQLQFSRYFKWRVFEIGFPQSTLVGFKPPLRIHQPVTRREGMGQWIGCLLVFMGQNRCSRCLLVDKIPENAFPGEKLMYYAFCQICSATDSQLIFLNNFLTLRRDRGSVFPYFF